MALTPEELEKGQFLLQEVNRLEAKIDEHLQAHFSKPYGNIPILFIERPRWIVKEKIREIYENAGWNVSFVDTDYADQEGVLLTQK